MSLVELDGVWCVVIKGDHNDGGNLRLVMVRKRDPDKVIFIVGRGGVDGSMRGKGLPVHFSVVM